MKANTRKDARTIRHKRVRKKVAGTGDRPRMSICISNRNMYVQFIDDESQRTLAAAKAVGREDGNHVGAATALGTRAAEAATNAGIQAVVVDRGGRRFHGRVKAVVDGAVEAGLKIRVDKET